MNKLYHVAFIMDGNGRWGKNILKVEISAISKEGDSKKDC